MKKLVAVALATTFVASGAFASSIILPFFVDGIIGGSDQAGFVGLINTTSETRVISVFYRDNAGQNRTPGVNSGATFTQVGGRPDRAPGTYTDDQTNVFSLNPGQSVSFRPGSELPGEGQGSFRTGGVPVPNMLGYQEDVDGNGEPDDTDIFVTNGSATFRWIGEPSDLAGRYEQNRGTALGLYVLPPGIATE